MSRMQRPYAHWNSSTLQVAAITSEAAHTRTHTRAMRRVKQMLDKTVRQLAVGRLSEASPRLCRVRHNLTRNVTASTCTLRCSPEGLESRDCGLENGGALVYVSQVRVSCGNFPFSFQPMHRLWIRAHLHPNSPFKAGYTHTHTHESNSRQFSSSDPSLQSVSPSQYQCSAIQLPSVQRNSLSEHLRLSVMARGGGRRGGGGGRNPQV